LLILRLSFPGLLRHPKNAWLVAELLRPAHFAALIASVVSLQWSGFDIRKVETVGHDNLEDPNRIGCAVAEGVRVHWPENKPLFVRLSVEDDAGWEPEQSARRAKILKMRRVAIIDGSSGGITGVAPILGKESERATGRRWPSMRAARPES
jgi:hypothetical protein